MIRPYGTSRKTQPIIQAVAPPRPARDPSITSLGFVCYGIERTGRTDQALTSVRRRDPTSAMGVFVHSAEQRRERAQRRMRSLDTVIREALTPSA